MVSAAISTNSTQEEDELFDGLAEAKAISAVHRGERHPL